MAEWYFGWPQLTWLCLMLVGLGIILAKHGEREDGRYNVYRTGAITLGLAVILYYGGFFTTVRP